MSSLSAFFAFYAAVLALQLSPGPDMMLVVGRGIGQGSRVAVLTAAGATLVVALIQLPLLALGVASLVQSSPIAFDILRWVGAVYLIWLGVKLLVGAGRPRPGGFEAPVPVSDIQALTDGAISNLANPKVVLFMLAFLPQFVDPSSIWPITFQLLFLGVVQKVSGFLVLATIGLSAGTFGSWLARRPGLFAWQERFSGLVMIILGLRLALTGDPRAIR